MQLELNVWMWALGFLGAMILGLSKSGIKGIGVLFVTIMALLFGSKASTGIVLPMLMLGDIYAVWYYHAHAKRKYLIILAPWMIIGILLGVFIGNEIGEQTFKQVMAIVILSTVIMMFWLERKPPKNVPTHWGFASAVGLLAGFTTMVGNLAGAFTNLYFLAIRIPKNEFIGTAAWLYFLMNIFKLPFHIIYWKTITWESVKVSFIFMPAVIIGLLVGVYLVKRIKETVYRRMILALTALGALMILFS